MDDINGGGDREGRRISYKVVTEYIMKKRETVGQVGEGKHKRSNLSHKRGMLIEWKSGRELLTCRGTNRQIAQHTTGGVQRERKKSK